MTAPRSCPREEEAVLLALHALDPEQEAVVARHVRSCATCGATVRDAEETFAAVGASAAQPPPERLRQRIMDATHGHGPPVVTRLDARRAARPARSPEPTAARRGPRRLLTAVAAALVVLGIAGGGVLWAQLGQQRDAATVHAATVDDVLAAIARSPHAVLVDRTGHPVGAVVLDDQPRFYSLDLGPLPADRQWVLWGAQGRSSTALGTVPSGSDGVTTPVSLGRPGEYEAYLLTQEPAGALPTSRGEPLASGPFTAGTGG